MVEAMGKSRTTNSLFPIYRTTVVGVIRLANLTTVELYTNLPGTMVYADFLTTLEPNLGLLCVSLPMLAGLLKRWFGRKASTAASYGGSSGNKTFGGGGGSGSHGRHTDRKKFQKMDDSIMMETIIDVMHNDTGSETELAPAAGKYEPTPIKTHIQGGRQM